MPENIQTDGSNPENVFPKGRISEDNQREKELASFTLIPVGNSFDIGGGAVFVPSYYPENVRVRRQRQLDRQRGFCGGEKVNDTGSKNMEIHVQGMMLGEGEKSSLYRISGVGRSLELVSETWSGECYLKEFEVEGPVGWYPPRSAFIYEYTMDLVSSGIDDPGQNQRYSPADDSEPNITGGPDQPP
jgi:hypothetical protein